MRRIAIFGGSFNPIHLGHIALAQKVLSEGLADEVWLMVSPHNPLKAQADLLDEQLRLELARRAVAQIKGVKASDFEFSLPRPSYTYRTLEALKAAYPDCLFSLLIGGDNWTIFPRWANHEAILANHPLIVYPRADSPIDASTLPPNVTLLEAPLFPFSSTDVRAAVRAGESIEEMVPHSIAKEVTLRYKHP